MRLLKVLLFMTVDQIIIASISICLSCIASFCVAWYTMQIFFKRYKETDEEYFKKLKQAQNEILDLLGNEINKYKS